MVSRYRWLIAAAVFLSILAAWRVFVARSAGSALERLRAQGLPTNPTELDKWYRPVPDADNLAAAILNAGTAYRMPRDTTNTPFTGILEVPPHPVDPQLVARWRTELENNRGMLDALRAGRGLTASRYPVNFRAGPNTMLPHLGQLKGLAQFCALTALTEAESGHPAEAVQDIEDILRIAKSLGPEPTLISQLVRIAIVQIAARAASICLPRAAVDENDLKRLQEAFATAGDPQGFRNGLIGEIALSAGSFSFFNAVVPATPNRGSQRAFTGDLAPRIGNLLYNASGLRVVDQTFCVERLTELVDASGHPFPEALRLGEQVQARVQQESERFARGFKFLSTLLLPALDKSLAKQAGCEAVARSAMVGCAVERHRLAHDGHLPNTLGDLVPALLPAVPADPFDGQPLRYLRTGDSHVIYSIGPDKLDNGGQLQGASSKYAKARGGSDIGFQVSR